MRALVVVMLLLSSALARAEERCASPSLSGARLDESLELGTAFMLHNQRAQGNFHYAYDWRARRDIDEDSAVRQAGATWGLALIRQDGGDVDEALSRALRFFARHSRKNGNGARFIAYPGTSQGSLGTVALIALAHIERLRGAPDAAKGQLRSQLDGYLAMLLGALRDEGGFHQSYGHDDGEPYGTASPYFDGEALLALVKAARYLGRSDLKRIALREADASYRRNVREALASDPDSAITKGYYQWASLAYFELATWDETSGDARHGDRLLYLADWMVNVHKAGKRARNTGYAYEGIIPAWVIARQRGDARALELDCAIGRGLGKLGGWQIGHSSANSYVRGAPRDDRRALGGIQNHAREPLLRIDVAQHQLHAVMLARRYWAPQGEERSAPQGEERSAPQGEKRSAPRPPETD